MTFVINFFFLKKFFYCINVNKIYNAQIFTLLIHKRSANACVFYKILPTPLSASHRIFIPAWRLVDNHNSNNLEASFLFVHNFKTQIIEKEIYIKLISML